MSENADNAIIRQRLELYRQRLSDANATIEEQNDEINRLEKKVLSVQKDIIAEKALRNKIHSKYEKYEDFIKNDVKDVFEDLHQLSHDIRWALHDIAKSELCGDELRAKIDDFCWKIKELSDGIDEPHLLYWYERWDEYWVKDAEEEKAAKG